MIFPYGLRMLRASAVGALLAAIWIVAIATPIVPRWPEPLTGLRLASNTPAWLYEPDGVSVKVLSWVLTRLAVDFTLEPAQTWAIVTLWPPAVLAILLFAKKIFKTASRGHCAIWWPVYAVRKAASILMMLVSVVSLTFGAFLALYAADVRAVFPEPFIRGAVLFAAPVLILWLPGLLVFTKEWVSESVIFRRWFCWGKGGSARWAGPRSLGKHLWRCSKGPRGPLSDQIYLGRTLFEDDGSPRDVAIGDDAMILTCAQPGAGKSVTAIWGALAMYKGSAILLDPKGEHANMLAAGRAKNTKKPSFVLDPFGESGMETHCYNALDDIDINSDYARGQLSAISDGCVLSEGDLSRHWTESAKLLQEGIMAELLSTYPRENQNLPFLFDLLQGINENGFADPEKFEELLVNMRVNPVAGGIAQQAATILDAMGDREKGSVLSTLQRSLKWVSDPAMRRQLCHSDFRFADLGREDGQTVFIVLPIPLIEEYRRWQRVLMNISIKSLQTLPKPPKTPVVVVADEYPKLGGELKAIDEGIVTLRAANVRIWIFVQSINQMMAIHAQNWQTFVSASTVQVFGVQDEITAGWVSRMLGERLNVRRNGKWWMPWFLKRVISEEIRPLLTPEEVMRELGKNSPKQIVFPNNGTPMRLERLAFKRLRIEGQLFRGSPLRRWFKRPKPVKEAMFVPQPITTIKTVSTTS